MTPITIDFDFVIKVIRPKFIQGLDSDVGPVISASGDFVYTSPPSIGTSKLASQVSLPSPTSEADLVARYLKDLDDLEDQINKLSAVIDSRCKHIIVNYNPQDPNDELITEACSTIYGSASGSISYEMYTSAIKTLNQLERTVAHQNTGTI
jgi:hypothetical protein